MAVLPLTVHFPDDLWRAVQSLAAHEGDTNTVILRALEEYITAARKRRGRHRPGNYKHLVKALSTPVAKLRLSARPLAALRTLNIAYVYELIQKSPRDLFRLRNFGEKSLREVKARLAARGLTFGMTLDDESYGAAVVATVGGNLRTRKG